MAHRRSKHDASRQLSATAASMYRAGHSIREIARTLGLAPSGVLWLLRREGVKTRKPHEWHGNPPRKVREGRAKKRRQAAA